MATPPYPEDEHSRQAYVDQLGLLEEGADEVFEEILAAATSYFQTPIALISILDHQRQWFRASIGLDIRQTPRRDSFCAYAILGKGVFEVADATLDPRFRDNPYVQGEPRIRFYAGAPLATAEGLNLGSLCVIDREPRGPLAERDVAMLEHFARLVMARIHTLRSTNYIDEPTGLYNRLRLQEDVSLRLQRDGALTVIAADLLPLALLNTIIRTLGYPFSNDLMLEARDRIRAELPDFTSTRSARRASDCSCHGSNRKKPSRSASACCGPSKAPSYVAGSRSRPTWASAYYHLPTIPSTAIRTGCAWWSARPTTPATAVSAGPATTRRWTRPSSVPSHC